MIEPHVAPGTVTPYLKAAQLQGLDIERILGTFELNSDALKQHQNRIPSSTSSLLLRQLIELCDDPWLGLHSANHVEIGNYDINGYISANCNTPLEAAKLTADLHQVLSDQRVLNVRETHEAVISTWNVPLDGDITQRNVADHLMASYVRYGRKILQLEGEPLYAKFKHKAPQDRDILQLYEEIFRCPLHFEQDDYSIALDREQARDSMIPLADSVLRDVLISHAQKRIQEINTTLPFTYQVKGVITHLLDTSAPCRERVAERLNMGSRTLQRRLLAEGSSFKDAFNEVRQELAQHYMRDSSLSLDDIAEKLGFSETRSFHRSFKQWTGETAGAYRSKLMDNQA